MANGALVKYILCMICTLMCHTISSQTAAVTQLESIAPAPWPYLFFSTLCFVRQWLVMVRLHLTALLSNLHARYPNTQNQQARGQNFSSCDWILIVLIGKFWIFWTKRCGQWIHETRVKGLHVRCGQIFKLANKINRNWSHDEVFCPCALCWPGSVC